MNRRQYVIAVLLAMQPYSIVCHDTNSASRTNRSRLRRLSYEATAAPSSTPTTGTIPPTSSASSTAMPSVLSSTGSPSFPQPTPSPTVLETVETPIKGQNQPNWSAGWGVLIPFMAVSCMVWAVQGKPRRLCEPCLDAAAVVPHEIVVKSRVEESFMDENASMVELTSIRKVASGDDSLTEILQSDFVRMK